MEKTFPDGTKVIVTEDSVELLDAGGNRVAQSEVSYFYRKDGFKLRSPKEVADKYHELYGEDAA